MNSADSTGSGASTAPVTGYGGDDVAHVVPLQVLVAVWAGLILLTVLTVAATEVDLGRGNLWIAMIIATIKGSLVALYFMHLRYDHPFYGLILMTALLFIALFIGLVIVDASALQSTAITGASAGT